MCGVETVSISVIDEGRQAAADCVCLFTGRYGLILCGASFGMHTRNAGGACGGDVCS